jgi:putative transposase
MVLLSFRFHHPEPTAQGKQRHPSSEVQHQPGHTPCEELGGHIVKGVLARDHVHMFLSIPPKLSLSDVMQRIKGRSSRRIQMEFPDLRKRYWGRRFWARGYFSTTSGNVTDDVIRQYLELHSSK